MTINATVWQPQWNQEGEYDTISAVNLTDPVSSANITDPTNSSVIVSTTNTFTAIPATPWTEDEGS